MRFALAFATAVLAFTASASAAPAATKLKKDKWYIQSSDGDFFTTTVAINGFTHYPMLAQQEHALPVMVTGTNGELQVDLRDIVGEDVTGSLTLEDEPALYGLRSAYFGDSSVVRATSGFNFNNGTLTTERDDFHGWYACNAGLNYRQLYWSNWPNATDDNTPPTCERVTLNVFEDFN